MTALLTLLTLVAFAANSVLCRMALDNGSIDPISFTVIRLTSGAIVLVPLAAVVGRRRVGRPDAGTWVAAFALLTYAVSFSLAYRSLPTGTGALILFGCVQATMIGSAVWAGDRLGPTRWMGVAAATAGLGYLASPGLGAPDPAGALLMAAAGVAWGAYSIRGRRQTDPIAATAGNFSRATLAALPLVAATPWTGHVTVTGATLAVVSGAVTSGLGYVVWYATLPRLSATEGAVVQLLVPAVAAAGGVLLLGESLTPRLIVASLLTLGGIALVVLAPERVTTRAPATPRDGSGRANPTD